MRLNASPARRRDERSHCIARILPAMGERQRGTDDVVAELAAKAAVAAGKDAATRAARGLLGDDDAGKTDATSKARKWKLIAGAVLALCVVLGLIGLVLNYWLWFLAAGVIGLAGLFGYWRLRAKLAARREAKGLPETAVDASAAKAMASAESVAKPAARRVDAEGAADAERRAEAAREARRLEAERDARARAEAEATREQEVDDELAAMKARLGK